MCVCWGGRGGGSHKSHFCNWHWVASSNSQQHSCMWWGRRNCNPQFSKLYMNRTPFFTLSKRACNRYMWKKWLLIDIIELIAATTSICCNPLQPLQQDARMMQSQILMCKEIDVILPTIEDLKQARRLIHPCTYKNMQFASSSSQQWILNMRESAIASYPILLAQTMWE